MIKINNVKNIVLDFDNTIVDTDKAVITLYREETGDYSTSVKNHKNWWFDDICPLWDRKRQQELFTSPELYNILQPMENAIETIKKLSEKYNITIVTVQEPKGIKYKSACIDKYLPFIKRVEYLDPGMYKNKSHMKADLILDDSVANLETSPCKYKVCFGEGLWNKNWNGIRAKNWYEVKCMLL